MVSPVTFIDRFFALARNTRKGGGKRRTEKTSGPGKPAGANFCPSCGAPATAGANFCQSCGANLQGGAAHKQRDVVSIVLYSVIGIAITVAVVGVVYVAGENKVAPPPAPAPTSPAARTEQPPDLSRMSPREAADRLFNRVVMASEQGDMPEVLRFAPKALQAYEGLADLDADAHYHLGLIHASVGDFDAVREQVAILRQYAPSHLLGLILEHDAAEKSDDQQGAAMAAIAFEAAYTAEIMAGRPEYEAHGNTIKSFHEKAAGG